MELSILIIVFLIGIIASLIGAIAGGGDALISIPALIFLGLPANVSVATNKLGGIGAATSTIFAYAQAKKIVYKYVVSFTVISAIGAGIGANILVRINEELLSKIIGVILLLVLPFIFIKKAGLIRKKVTKIHLTVGFILFFCIAVYGGSFSVGGGILALMILIYMFGLTYIEANATNRIPWLAEILVSLIVFIYFGLVNYFYGIALLLGRFIGGYFGAKIAVKQGEKFVKTFFAIFVIVSAIKLLFF